MDLDQVIYDHAEWKTRFRTAITQRVCMDATAIGSDQCCNLGKWLHGEGRHSSGHLTAFTFLVQTHAAFHHEAGKIASLINAGDIKSAEAELEYGTRYSRAAQGVALAIMSLQEEMPRELA